MAHGNKIVISSPPRGRFIEGVYEGTSKPGTFVQIKAATAFTGGGYGEPHFVDAAPGTDGKDILLAVLCEDNLQGFDINTAYPGVQSNGQYPKCKVYCPVHGDELNLRVGEVAGTGNTFAIGDRFEINATAGYLIPESGSPQATIAVCMEALTQQAADSLVWCMIM